MDECCIIFRVWNNCRLRFYVLDVPSWRVLKRVSFFVRGCSGFWYLHRRFDGNGFACVPSRSGIQTHIPFQ